MHERAPVDREGPQRQLQDAATGLAPRADQPGQAGQRPDRLATAGVPLDGDADPDDRGLGGGVLPGQGADGVGGDAGLRLGPLRGVLLDPLGELGVADGELLDVVVVGQPLGDDHVRHRQGQRAVGARAQRDVLVGGGGRAGPHRVDHDDLGAARAGLGDVGPQVQVRALHVAGPDQDEPGVHQALRVDPGGVADGHRVGGAGPGVAVGPLGDRGTQLREERVAHVEAVEDALGAQVADRHDRLGAELLDGGPQPGGDLADRGVPADPLELPAALGAGAAHREQHPAGVVHPVQVVVDLHAQAAGGVRVVGVAGHLDGDAVGDGHEHRAGVRAVVRAGAADDGGLLRRGGAGFRRRERHGGLRGSGRGVLPTLARVPPPVLAQLTRTLSLRGQPRRTRLSGPWPPGSGPGRPAARARGPRSAPGSRPGRRRAPSRARARAWRPGRAARAPSA
ncbi:unannotated protein [freshwater metagenome]|uniref:Unannotated protein n=1 Tax=freshwater metagenome TaxID=449393 RepID=A0A6J7HK18_9ZZZZ